MKTRIEQKREISPRDYPLFLRWLKNHGSKVLFPERIICSIYFDTQNLTSFYDTKEGLVPRKKIRIRTYNTKSFFESNDLYKFEIKKTTEHERLKSISNIKLDKGLFDNGIYVKDYGICIPSVQVSYIREYFKVGRVRLTIDRDIEYTQIRPTKSKQSMKVIDRSFVIEIKGDARESLFYLNNFFNFSRSRFSKYERAIASIY